MVLNELGSMLVGAIQRATQQKTYDTTTATTMIDDICDSLVQSDVRLDLVEDLKKTLLKNLSPEIVMSSRNPYGTVMQGISTEILNLLDPGTKPYQPKHERTNVIMFVGLQGAGKTTTIAKYAMHYKRKGYRCGLIAADTFRAGAIDQLVQNARGASVPYFAMRDETDPVVVAREGVEHFKSMGINLICIDTSGRHCQADELFAEMQQINAAIHPDETILVMDGSIGQSAYEQAKAFHQAVGVGSVIITKTDGHARGGGALSAVAATGAPISFLGTGEKRGDFEAFIPDRFVGRLLGFGDI